MDSMDLERERGSRSCRSRPRSGTTASRSISSDTPGTCRFRRRGRTHHEDGGWRSSRRRRSRWTASADELCPAQGDGKRPQTHRHHQQDRSGKCSAAQGARYEIFELFLELKATDEQTRFPPSLCQCEAGICQASRSLMIPATPCCPSSRPSSHMSLRLKSRTQVISVPDRDASRLHDYWVGLPTDAWSAADDRTERRVPPRRQTDQENHVQMLTAIFSHEASGENSGESARKETSWGSPGLRGRFYRRDDYRQ